MPVICGSFSGAQVGPSTRTAFVMQWLGYAGFESQFQESATGFSKSEGIEVNRTAPLIGGGEVPRSQVLIFNIAQQFSRWGGRPQEQRSDAGGGSGCLWRVVRRCVNDAKERASRPESGPQKRCVANRRDTVSASCPVRSLRTRISLGVNFKELTPHSP